jgi:hypothetical protein
MTRLAQRNEVSALAEVSQLTAFAVQFLGKQNILDPEHPAHGYPHRISRHPRRINQPLKADQLLQERHAACLGLEGIIPVKKLSVH